MTVSVRIELLGPFRVLVDGIAVGAGHRQRALLAVLALRANQVCSREDLLDAVWSDDLPASGLKVLPPNIYRVRQLLGGGDELIEGTANGYLLRVPPVVLDVDEFSRPRRRQSKGGSKVTPPAPGPPTGQHRGWSVASR